MENISHTPVDWVIDYVTINWEFTDDQSGMDYCILPDGTRTNDTSGRYVVGDNGNYTFKAYDRLGNEKIVIEPINNIDKIAPGGVLTVSNNELTDNSIQILWEVYDRESGFSKIILPDSTVSNSATGSFPISQMGEYSFVVYDKVGNDKKLNIIVNNVDMEKPKLTVTQEVTRWTNEDILLDYEAIDNQSGIREVVFPNSLNTSETKGKYAVTKNGEYTFLAYDQIGNGIMVTHTVSNIDKTPPVLKLKRSYDNDDNIRITWEMLDTESGTRNIVLPDGRITSDKSGEYIVKQNGIYTFIAYDNVGNDNVMQVEISNVDKTGIEFELHEESLIDNRKRITWKVLEGQDDFTYILLPDNTYSHNKQGEFIVNKRGKYTFLAYDKFGNETQRSIIINM